MKMPDQPLLAEIARRMLEDAPNHCDELCRAYHGVWGYLRLFESLPSVGLDHDVLLDRLGGFADAGAGRVLVSGAADCGILAYVIEAFERAGVRGSAHVADFCETPLLACRWYGAERGWPVETTRGDIVDFEGRGFDVVVAHNFLNFFSAEHRVQVAQRWHDALVPGGHVLLITRLKPEAPPVARRFGPERTEALVDDVLAGRERSPYCGAISAGELEALVREYAGRRESRPFRTVDELRAPFDAVGLSIKSVTTHQPATDAVAGDHAGVRTCIVAERPLRGPAS
jgi:SAM-dependent methyltransferase